MKFGLTPLGAFFWGDNRGLSDEVILPLYNAAYPDSPIFLRGNTFLCGATQYIRREDIVEKLNAAFATAEGPANPPASGKPMFTTGKADIWMHRPDGSKLVATPVFVCQRFNAYAAALGLGGRLEYRKLEGYVISEWPTGWGRVGWDRVADLLNDQIELLNELKG